MTVRTLTCDSCRSGPSPLHQVLYMAFAIFSGVSFYYHPVNFYFVSHALFSLAHKQAHEQPHSISHPQSPHF